MNNISTVSAKPLPPPARDEKLPSLPPPEAHMLGDSVPAPPPKVVYNPDPDADLRLGLDGYGSAISGSGSGANAQSSTDSKPKRSNPLVDLIETEKLYVDLLTGIIRKVAAAWSRSNLPPPELDTMFRSIEGIFKANRGLLSKLKEIGNNPSSPKALGDLLMRWIDDLETPYTTYSTKFCSGFNYWEPVQSNARLRTVLAMFSSTNPPPLPASAPTHPAEPPIWTLDDLFLLPKNRLKYYKKLYARLLKSTTPGRSDHKLLTGALEKLDKLGEILDSRATTDVGAFESDKQTPARAVSEEAEDEVVIDMRLRDSTFPIQSATNNATLSPVRSSDSTHGSSSRGRRSDDTAPTSEDRSSTVSVPANDLERRLSTERTLDIFNMKPKQVRLQINPPSLHYTRDLRFSADVLISLTPKSTGVEVIQQRGHVFILTDLLLVCERMTPQERLQGGPDGPDMWLTYPPLAGKHLRVAPLDGSDTALSVTIMRKEALYLHASSRILRDKLVAEFRECIDMAATLIPSSKTTPPPVPQLPPIGDLSMQQQQQHRPMPPPRMPSGQFDSPQSPSRALSPMSMDSRNSNEPMSRPMRGSSGSSERVVSDASSERMFRHGGPPDHVQYNQSGFPPPRSVSSGGPPGQGPPPLSRGPSFGPGQVMPSQSFSPGQVVRQQSFSVGQVMPHQGDPNLGRPPNFGYPQGISPQSPVRNGPGPGQFLPGGPPRGPQGPLAGHPAPFAHPPPRPPSDPSFQGGVRKSPSSRSLAFQHEQHSQGPAPPMPNYPGEYPPPRPGFVQRNGSSSSLPTMSSLANAQPLRPILPSAQLSMKSLPPADSFQDPSPPGSPVQETRPPEGPTTSRITAQMKCKVFLKQQHEQWKSLGGAKLKLYHESPTNVKQLVVEDKSVLISTIILADGVERVGKTGVAVELSDRGQRTGIIYMLQLKNESTSRGLFDSLLAGSDRFAVHGKA